ncbi:MFS transporter [Mangrovactinospora gilvigrisea]|uniref:MFS transporter n=1 Tax=Mangrovactinospora gilvigrisea TaxID=1428644 RepID=A0A1J7BIK7_9ACTN|nr:MFS transporter [Mangrovactinospora gilvigrisea]OIV38470.1 MFS transporter [Mangrovactinospora gilvigrisea]
MSLTTGARTGAPHRPFAPRSQRLSAVLAMLGFVLVAANMRAAVSAVSPLVEEIEHRYHLGSGGGGLLTTLPVLMMSVGAPVAAWLARRQGTERAVLLGLGLLVAGILLRVLPSQAALFGGSVLTGLAITVLNVLMPGIVKRDFPEKAALMTGVYTTVMIGGATAAAALSVPLERSLGGWAGSLGVWALLAAAAFVVWLPQLVRNERPAARAAAASSGQEPSGWLRRSPLAWQIAVFMGICSLLSYTAIAWLPTIFTDHGMSHADAGAVFAFSTFVQLFSAFLVPLAAGRGMRLRNKGGGGRQGGQRALVVVMVGCNAAGFAGLLAAPIGGAYLWAVLLGLAQGGSFGLALTILVLRAGDAAVAARLSGMAQLIGYLIAAIGPVGAGLLRQATGSWTLPLVLLLVACGVGLAAGLGAGRNVSLRIPATRSGR